MLCVSRIAAINTQNTANPLKMKTIRCPPGLKAFAGFPSEDCPSEAHFYKCVKGIAVVSKCNSTSRYDPVLSDCAPSKGTTAIQRKLSEGGSPAEYRIDVDALGREVHLGNIYYGQDDHIATDQNMWTSESLKKRKNVEKKISKNEIRITESVVDRLNVLDIDASLKLSFLGGLVSVSGSARYLDDRRDRKEMVSVTFLYDSINRVESVTQEMRLQTDYYDDLCKNIGKGGPTHVVSSVTRGFRGVLNFKKYLSDFSKESEVQGRLKAVINNLPSIQIEAEAGVKISENEKILVQDLDVSFSGDTILDESISNFEDAVSVYKDFSKFALKSQNIVKFSLSPIENYCTGDIQSILREITGQITDQIFSSVENLDKLMIRVESLENSAPANAFPSTIKTNINLFKKELTKYRNSFSQSLGEILPKVRGQFIGESGLIEVLNDLADSPFEQGRSDIFLDKLEKEIGTIALYMKRKGDPGKGIVVEEDSSAKGNECRTRFAFQIEFVLPVLPDDDQVNNYLNGTLHDDVTTWYDNSTQVTNAGGVYRNFKNFFDLNKDVNKEACFIVGLKKIRENQVPIITIFGLGKKITDNLNVPTKLEPENIQISIDKIDFDIRYKTDFKSGNVMNYIELIYQGLSEKGDFPKNSKTVSIAGKGVTTISLTRLKLGTNYAIKQRLVSKLHGKVWAVGPWSNDISVTTSFNSPPSSLSVKNKEETGLTLSWGSPTFKAPGSIIKFNVEVYMDSCDKMTIAEKPETNSPTTIQKLKAASLYCIIVKATNTKLTTSDCFLTKEDKTRKNLDCHYQTSVSIAATTNPSPPTGLIIKYVDGSSVKLEWKRSTIPPGETLVNYVIDYIKFDSKTKQPLAGATTSSFKSNQETVTITKLPSGVTFLFKVKMVTSQGASKLSSGVTVTTLIPSPPSGLIIKNVDGSSVKLEWRKSTIPPGETLVDYVVDYIKVDSRTKQPLAGATISSWTTRLESTTISALPSGVTFLFKVKVVTTKQASKFSNEVSATTIFKETELEKFKKSLNLDGMNAAIKQQVAATSGIKADINYLKTNAGNKAELNALKSKVEKRVNGGWGSWGAWSNCRLSGRIRVRTRSCNNPVPLNGGSRCSGPGSELGKCTEKCTWGHSSFWSCCTKTNPCYEGEGDCDSDSDCVGGLVCGTDNCNSRVPDSGADCCTKPANKCPTGWSLFARNQKCYRRFTNSLTWGEANSACAKAHHGGILAVIPDSGTQSFITSLTPNSAWTKSWIGGYRSGSIFKWSNSRLAMTYSSWYPGEPNNHGGNQNYVAIYSQQNGGKWDDNNYNTKMAYICEFWLKKFV